LLVAGWFAVAGVRSGGGWRDIEMVGAGARGV
jgi:hypothetical protein